MARQVSESRLLLQRDAADPEAEIESVIALQMEISVTDQGAFFLLHRGDQFISVIECVGFMERQFATKKRRSPPERLR